MRVWYGANGWVSTPISAAAKCLFLKDRAAETAISAERRSPVRRTCCQPLEERIEHFGLASDGVAQSEGSDRGMAVFIWMGEVASHEVVGLYSKRGRLGYMVQASVDGWQEVGHRITINLDFIQKPEKTCGRY